MKLTIDLLDINVWLPLIDENHTVHREALDYWDTKRQASVAFCRVTMLGLFRMGTSRTVMSGEPFSFSEMWGIYQDLIQRPEVTFLKEPDLDRHLRVATDQADFKNARWTDAYLSAFVNTSGCRLVTFDKGFKQLKVDDWLLLQHST